MHYRIVGISDEGLTLTVVPWSGVIVGISEEGLTLTVVPWWGVSLVLG